MDERPKRSPELIAELSTELVALARLEETTAAMEAASTPYWSPSPLSVATHRSVARLLRAYAARLETEARLSRSGPGPLHARSV
jgi:hypothetical protein